VLLLLLLLLRLRAVGAVGAAGRGEGFVAAAALLLPPLASPLRFLAAPFRCACAPCASCTCVPAAAACWNHFGA
jgi:hypothetical protein